MGWVGEGGGAVMLAQQRTQRKAGQGWSAADKRWIFHFRNINSEVVFMRTSKWNM